jgi:oxygen-independent coproporphyrinogen-3 oxidase
MDEYLACLERELDSIKPLLTNLQSVYIGGGTPFVLEPRELERVYKAIARVLPKQVEYTVEAGRADVFTEEKLALSKQYGINRICVNPQSFLDKTLVAIGRKHTAADVLRAFEMTKKYDFIVNCDLIAGLAEESAEEFATSLQQAIDMDFENITVHTLCLKVGARLKEEVKALSGEGIAEMMRRSREMLTANGYEPYYLYRQKYQAGGGENVGWTKKGKACVYNVNTMEELTDNIAVGAGSVSKKVCLENGVLSNESRIERFGAPKDIKTYIEKCDKLIADRLEFYRG